MTTTYISPELDAKVRAKMEWCRQIVRQHSGQDIVPILSYDVRGRVAGRGGVRPGTVPIVRFNPILLKENEHDMIETTVPHEYAHAVQYTLYGRRIRGNTPHGYYWKLIMAWFGIHNPDRTHSYDVSNAVVRRHQKFDFHCQCRTIKIGKNMAGKIMAGKRYYCQKCDCLVVPLDKQSMPRKFSRLVPVITCTTQVPDPVTMTLSNVPA